MMPLDYPGTIWSHRHAEALNALDHVTFAPLAMFGGIPPTVAHAGPANSTATTRSNSVSAIDEWNSAIAQRMAANGWTKQQAAQR